MIMSEQAYKEYPHHLENPENIKLIQKLRDLTKTEKKLIKARAFRMWVQNNSKINLFTYFYYRIKDRELIKLIHKELSGGSY